MTTSKLADRHRSRADGCGIAPSIVSVVDSFASSETARSGVFRVAAPQPLTEGEELLWRSLIQLVVRIPRVTDDDFAHDSKLATSEYVVLMHLSEAPDHELRMSELAARTTLSASRITRLVDDLDRAGLVVKTRCNSDGRGNLAMLTNAGSQRPMAAHVPHLQRVRTRFLDGLPPREVAVAGRAIARVLDNLHQSLRDSGEPEPAESMDRSTR